MKSQLTILLFFLGWSVWGQEACPNTHDVNANGTIDIEDFLSILGLFADVDQDLDGIWDSLDSCIDLNACNFASDPTEPCSYLDVLGVCGGQCEGDGDGDGICDDVDTCVGVIDECGVCNGPGPTEIVIDQIITTYDSIYLPVDGEWFVYAVDVDTTYTVACDPVFLSCGDPVSYQGYDYATVLIGEQCWFAENLRSENYENGDLIPANLSNYEWNTSTSGAVAVYGEGNSTCYNYSPDGDACDEEWSLNEYGRLYNWYAVDDTRGLCPSGWHVPTDGEWTVVNDYLGGQAIAGGNLKTDYGWYNGGDGTNSSGFSCLPGGYRDDLGRFILAGKEGHWMSATIQQSYQWWRLLEFETNLFYSAFGPPFPKIGRSVRCIKDAE